MNLPLIKIRRMAPRKIHHHLTQAGYALNDLRAIVREYAPDKTLLREIQKAIAVMTGVRGISRNFAFDPPQRASARFARAAQQSLYPDQQPPSARKPSGKNKGAQP